MKRILRFLFKSAITLVALFVGVVIVSHVLVGCESDPRAFNPPTTQPAPQLRVMTYNVNFSAAPDKSAELIRKTTPDVVFLQENTSPWEEFVNSRMNDLYPHAKFHHDQYAGGMAILSRWPINDLFYETPPDGWFNGWGATIQTPQGEVNFLGVHLRPGASGQGGLSYLNYFRLPKVHWLEIDWLYRRMQEKGPSVPTIILGDFNESDDQSALWYLHEKGFTNALPLFDKHSKTWHGRHFGVALSNRCDHILFGGDFKCLDSAVLSGGDSDHQPVVAVLEMNIQRN